jgi:nicotinamide-nucleotide amidase
MSSTAGLEHEIGELLRRKGLTLGAVESATGGLISHLITNVPGSSDYYKGSVTAYANETKINVIGVKAATLKKYGVVSPPVAEEMASGGRRVLGVDICIADTGIAGPGGATPGKSVGLFYLGLAHQGGAFSRKHEFHGTRLQNKKSAAQAALSWLKEYLLALIK